MQILEILLQEIPFSGFLHVTDLSVYTVILWNRPSADINGAIWLKSM